MVEKNSKKVKKEEGIRVLMVQKYNLLKEAELLYQKGQELHRDLLALCGQRARKLEQADLVENQVFVDVLHLPLIGSKSSKKKGER